MSNKSTNPKGTKDYGPNELLSVRFIINKIQTFLFPSATAKLRLHQLKKEQHFTKNMVMRVINLFSI